MGEMPTEGTGVLIEAVRRRASQKSKLDGPLGL